MLLTVEELREILRRETPPPREALRPLAEARGHALAEEVLADRDAPPFDRSMMDGYAVRAADLARPPRELSVVEEIPAGRMGHRTVGPGECARIMTGAPVPPGADAVIQHERTEPGERSDRVRILAAVAPGTNIARRGGEVRAGTVVLRRGAPLGAAEIAVAASMGRPTLRVYAKPAVAVLATGDELVEPDRTPEGGQIRNSNAAMLAAQAAEAGFDADNLGIARDDRDDLRRRIAAALESRDVLILSGGVSAGAYDLVVEALRAEGVETVAHKVAIKPGKPIYFGRRGARRVFGLPGNPLSAFVTFEVFLRPFLGGMCALALERRRGRARLAAGLGAARDRARYIPAKLEEDGASVRPILPASSGDIISVTRADAFVIVPAGSAPEPGDPVEVMRLRDGTAE